MTLKIIDVAGLKKSGKTTVIENLVSELTNRGFKVGTIKKIHIPDFTIDTEGKDTFRHKVAGADFVISLAPTELAFIQKQTKRLTLDEVLHLVPKDTEFLVCEELNEASDDILYIITLKSLDLLDDTMKVRALGKNILAISGVVSNTISAHDKYPIINTTTKEGRNQLVEMILNK